MRQPLRIAIISDYYYPQLGGITEHVHGQATALARRGHEVTVVAPRLLVVPRTVDPEPPPREGFDVVHVGRAYPFYVNGSECLQTLGARLPHALDHALRELRPDVVHVHNPFGFMLPILAIVRSRAPATVATFHSVVPENYRLLRALRRPLEAVVRATDANIAVSRAVVDSMRDYFPGLGFEVVPNGIDTTFFTPEAEPLPHLGGKRNVLFVGRFDPRNGLKHMVRAFVTLREMRSDCRLVVLGDGPLRPLIKRLVPHELAEDVLFEGRVNRLRPRYLVSAELLCAPCGLASFGMVVLEAMSCGLPVVATRLPGFCEVMEDGAHGLMVDRPDDTDGFAAAMNRLLDAPEWARALGTAGRERSVGTFSWALLAERLEELYGDLLARDGRLRVA